MKNSRSLIWDTATSITPPLMLSRRRAQGPRYRFDARTTWLGMAAQAAAAGADACFGRILAALHESRRKQAAIQRARHRYLIFESETGTYFGTSSPAQDVTRAE
jgi:hypothetical protein